MKSREFEDDAYFDVDATEVSGPVKSAPSLMILFSRQYPRSSKGAVGTWNAARSK